MMIKLKITFLLLIVYCNVNAQKNYTWVVAAKYMSIYNTGNGNFLGRYGKTGKADILDSTGRTVVAGVMNVRSYSNGIIKYQKANSEQGCFINLQKKIICTEWIVDAININGDDYVTIPGIEFLDYNNKKIELPTNFDENKYAIVNYLGNNFWTLKLKDTVYTPLSTICTNCGLLTPKGIVIEPNDNQFIDEFIDGYALYKSYDNSFKFLKPDGSFAPVNITAENEFQNAIAGLNFYAQNGKMGLLFQNGKLIEAKYKIAEPIKVRGLVILQNLEGKYGAFDKNGEEASSFVYLDEAKLLEYRENIFLFKEKNKFGYQDDIFKTLIAPQFIYASIFFGNYAVVSNIAKKYGIINRQGKLVVPYSFDDIKFLDIPNSFLVKLKGKEGVIKMTN